LKVLVVDDEPVWLQATLELLGRAGYTVRGAPGFQPALKAPRRDHGRSGVRRRVED
jgi:CheY-like chemotaxis protein